MSNSISERLNDYIEFATKTKKFSDVGFYEDVKAEIERLLALNEELVDALSLMLEYTEAPCTLNRTEVILKVTASLSKAKEHSNG